MRFGIVLKENLERYAYVSNIPRLQRFSISVLQPRDIRYLSNLFSIKCHVTMMNQSTNQSISYHFKTKVFIGLCISNFIFGFPLWQDLIEAVVQLQSQLECQGKKQVELEDYLDSLLMKVMAKAPDLLQKDLTMTAASKLTPSIK